MNNIKKNALRLTVLLTALLCVACTDGQLGKLSALGGSANVKCYSAEKLIYDGNSTGKVSSSSQSDGYYFVDKKDGKLKEVSGNCVITYNEY